MGLSEWIKVSNEIIVKKIEHAQIFEDGQAYTLPVAIMRNDVQQLDSGLYRIQGTTHHFCVNHEKDSFLYPKSLPMDIMTELVSYHRANQPYPPTKLGVERAETEEEAKIIQLFTVKEIWSLNLTKTSVEIIFPHIKFHNPYRDIRFPEFDIYVSHDIIFVHRQKPLVIFINNPDANYLKCIH